MAKYIEQGTNYSYTIERIENITFAKLRGAAIDFTRRLPSSLADELYKDMQHGVCQLQSEPVLNMYLHSFGLMHEAKLQHAFKHLPSEFTDHEAIEIIDYGCGQAIGTICYADFLRKNGKSQKVKKVTLIEPSELALKRAALHTSCFLPEAEVVTINKGFDDLAEDDLDIDDEIATLHIFSNVLDLAGEYFNLGNLANLIKGCSKGENLYICIEPYFEYDDKDIYPDIFFQKLGIEPYYRQIFQKGEFVEGREWTCFVAICKKNNEWAWHEHEGVITTDAGEYLIDMRLLIESAEQGDIHAQCVLGNCYYDGSNGVEKNEIEAVKWYHKAAVSGDSYA
ncbi:MAG: sel1 repeat family protein, partial [Bacteroidaceae bacterium]|nr:sel1 repeat family protein [Bacteroidaceae bacterium]